MREELEPRLVSFLSNSSSFVSKILMETCSRVATLHRSSLPLVTSDTTRSILFSFSNVYSAIVKESLASSTELTLSTF
ncbi:hypothetical protein HUT03_04400 [Candidatus Liberibacter africanus]|uniref:hypothetical protein n=1 Tax=Liberibacter africanus TaxID=34020 RepID=UPI0011DD5784|nr:hypothetical protein [Candidatus Liberibacter africanus]QTP64200.1 hypothetical protein HUT03_04400 [Candidatus Liberibacter africanus]